MNPVAAQQVALDNALVAPEKRLKIEKCNMRIEFHKRQREPTYQTPNQDFVKPPSEEEMVPFIKELRYISGKSTCTGYSLKDEKRSQTGQNRERNWKEREKPKPKINDDDNDHDGNNAENDNDHEQDDDERTKFDDEEEETQNDEFVHTPDDYVQTDNEKHDESDDVTEEEYERINEELYGDVNVSLTDAKPANKEKDDEEMTVVGHVNVNQEGAGNQVKDDAQETQKTEGPIPSSSISSDYAAKYLNFDNIPLVDTEVVSMLDINVQHEVSRTSPLLTILVITNLEKDVKELKTVDHSTSLLSTIKSEVLNAIKEYLGTSLDDALYKRLRQQYVPDKSTEDIRKIKMEHARKQQEPKETITSSDTTTLEEFDQKTTFFEVMTKSKSFNKSPKQRALYHDLMESILEDENVMDKDVADKLKKRKQDD
ncbi:hypothetical protein Tco_1109645 [Tanacetum coccineum]